ncbi:MAG: hypothetical protein IPO33_14285 [Saprospiraceae bacterium]|nr:hypothetical protein [Candidatus Brachybacter algidus]
MIDCVITAYHRKLNDKPIQFEELANYYYKKQMAVTEKLKREELRDSKKEKKVVNIF